MATTIWESGEKSMKANEFDATFENGEEIVESSGRESLIVDITELIEVLKDRVHLVPSLSCQGLFSSVSRTPPASRCCVARQRVSIAYLLCYDPEQ